MIMKTKAIVVLVLTLVIGFILGMLTSAQIRHSRMKEMRTFFSGKDYAEMMMNVIQPDEVQKAKLEEVMGRYYKTTRNMQSDFRTDFDSVTTSFKKEIDTLLTAEQLERVRELETRNREMMQEMRKEPREYHRPGGGRSGAGRKDSQPDDRKERRRD